MRKLTLDLDELAVESFETAVEARGIGTVNGRALAPAPDPDIDRSPLLSCRTCFSMCRTCEISCNGTCISCPATCFDVTCATCGGESCGPTMCRMSFVDGCCA